jgi:hypothetical protein
MNARKLSVLNLLSTFVSRCVLSVFVVVSVFGLYICTSLFTKMAGPTSTPAHHASSYNCVFGIGADDWSWCPMGVIEHISSWQQLFTAVVPVDVLALLGVLFVFVAGFVLRTLLHHTSSPPYSVVRLGQYYKRQWGMRLYNYFLTIFADGILQPKRFA